MRPGDKADAEAKDLIKAIDSTAIARVRRISLPSGRLVVSTRDIIIKYKYDTDYFLLLK